MLKRRPESRVLTTARPRELKSLSDFMQEAGAGVLTVTTPGERHAPPTRAQHQCALHILATCDPPLLCDLFMAQSLILIPNLKYFESRNFDQKP